MPLAFDSLSHGLVPFGFFNIETQMLLLDRLFFFAEDFCRAVIQLAAGEASSGERASHVEAALDGWLIAARPAVGDLHGAIAGEDLSGFIGATYERCPFPSDPAAFKQNPEGRLERREVERLILPFGEAARITLARELRESLLISVGAPALAEPYIFSEAGFAKLVGYVERGGYPRWKDERRPPYVLEMMQWLAERDSPLRPTTDESSRGGAQ
jgi:hypothetical protein